MDFSKLAAYNSNYKWVLSVVDLFTKKAWAAALKNKSAPEVWAALSKLLDEMPESPHIIQSDNGNEFKGEVSEGLGRLDIKQIFSSPYHPQSQGAVEAFNGTFKRYLRRYMAENESKKWTEFMPDILNNYNNTIHSTTKHKPIELENVPHDEKKQAKLRETSKNIIAAAKRSSSYATSFRDDINVGDYVRTALETTKDLMKNKLSKRNLNPTYSKEIYRVTRVIKPRESSVTSITPIKYRLADEENKAVPGLFYRLRLQKTVAPDKQVGKSADNNDSELSRDDEDDKDDKNKAAEAPKPDQPIASEPVIEEKKEPEAVAEAPAEAVPKRRRKKPVAQEPSRRSTRERRPNSNLRDYA
jgi:hypothetical protein